MSAVLEAREPNARYLASAPPKLVRHFELCGKAHGSIARLRQLVLMLAIQGKLVPQRPEDEPADLLLERVERQKEELVAKGALKRPKPQAEINGDDLPFPAPMGWKWVRLGALLQKIGAGSTPLGGKEVYVKAGVKFLRSQNVWDDGLRLDGVAHISPATHAKMAGTAVVANDLLFNITGASIGRCAVVPSDFDEANVSQHVTIIRPVLSALNAYLHKVLISPLVQQAVMDVQVGVSREGLSIAKLGNFLVPIPPLQEQARIVARVDELMRLYDALEAKGRLEAEQHARLLGTLLGTLTDSGTPEELTANWQRVADHFDLLLDRPEAVDVLEQTILQLAVQGLLVQQDPSDEPASVLLRSIYEEKDRLAAAGKIKRAKVIPAVATEDAPFALPDSWVWSRLGAVAKKITDGTHHSPANFADGDFKYLSAKNIKSWGIDLTDVTYVPSSVHQEIYSRCDPEYGDILYIKDGATTGVLTINTLKEQFSLLSSVGVVKPSCGVTSEYLALLMRSPFFYQAMRDGMTGVAITRVTLSKLGAALVPLPPLAEQARIVARVDELRRLCADLRHRLERSSATQTALAGALIDQALVT